MVFNFIQKLPILTMEYRYLEIFYFQYVKLKELEYYLMKKERLVKEIKDTVKKDRVICALSGGVDSSVVAL